MITTEMIKQLRERTGAGIMECKNTLIEVQGDMDKATACLNKKGMDFVSKKADRIAAEGIVDAYIHGDGRIGVLLEVNIETDFAALNKEFRSFVKDVALQIAASKPQFIKRTDISDEILNEKRESFRTQVRNEGKPENIIGKIVEGKMEKYFKQICLLEQPFIKDPDRTVQELLNEKVLTIGENIMIRRFSRFEMGEGIAKKEEDFVEEVRKQACSY
ncbi:MAG: translation elongation factor Ts [Clostridia bacterium]|nr:translation elongation factor Ts [Clostridia bacterium]